MSLGSCARCWDNPCTCAGSAYALAEVARSFGFVSEGASQSPDAADALRAALERARVVGVLDAWVADKFGAQHWVRREVGFICVVHWPDAKLFREFGKYDTEDAARAAAARAIESGEV